ncbi:hypothetical protein AURDEDRAFT_125315 [Auricularia subglabra TFB-10046 SS5]|nr:hypothetical protein AURDEDRAFT_125315 [Auricularia subglabra TFB-10046 SS5]
MPVSFGSCGDIVAVLQLAWQLRVVLSDAAGGSAEIHALISDVEAFTRALQEIRPAVERRCTPLPPALENGIKHALITCHDILSAILDKVSAFRTRVASRVSMAAWHQYWALAAWSILGGHKEVDALRRRLSEQIAIIQTYLGLLQSRDQDRILSTVDNQGTTLHRLCSIMQDIQVRFDVGVPSFHFCDRSTGTYYKPFARTSVAMSENRRMLDITIDRLNRRDMRAPISNTEGQEVTIMDFP